MASHGELVIGGISYLITLISLPLIPSTGLMAELLHSRAVQIPFLVGNTIVAIFIYYTVHQLRMVTRINTTAASVSLFQRSPIYVGVLVSL